MKYLNCISFHADAATVFRYLNIVDFNLSMQSFIFHSTFLIHCFYLFFKKMLFICYQYETNGVRSFISTLTFFQTFGIRS